MPSDLASAAWRPVAPEGLHLTLAFLGARPQEDVAVCVRALEPIAIGPAPALRLGAPVVLGRALALEVADPDGALASLQARVGEALAGAGVYAPEARPFRPHVTLARLRGGARASRLPVVAASGTAVAATALTLYRSELSPAGARYTPEWRRALA